MVALFILPSSFTAWQPTAWSVVEVSGPSMALYICMVGAGDVSAILVRAATYCSLAVLCFLLTLRNY